MATATKRVEVKTVERITGVNLKLNADEAQVLADVLATVGGSPDRSNRKHSQAIYQALEASGVRYRDRCHSGLDGGLFFEAVGDAGKDN